MERGKRSFPPNPKETANPLSSLTFFWTLPLFIVGSKRKLELDDMYETLKKDKSNTIGDTLERHFLKSEKKCDAQRKARGITDPKKGPQPSLGWALVKTFWVELFFLGIIIFVSEIIVRLTSPVLLGMLLDYFRPGSSMERSNALWCAGGIVFLSGCTAITLNHYTIGCSHMGMRARVGVCSLIYRKSLRLSRNALGESAPGKVVNLLCNDVNRLDIACYFIHYLWLAPLVSGVVLYFLWIEIGFSGILGVLVIFTVVPIQAYAGKLSARFRLQTALKTDERVRLMGEIISGVQVIKMYAWEKPFRDLITLARRLEVKVICKNAYVRGVYMTFLLITTRIAMFFVMFSMVLFRYKITSAKIFVVATYFSLLASTFSAMFVRAIAEIAEAYVALKRLQNYLQLEEVAKPHPLIIADLTDDDLKSSGEKMESKPANNVSVKMTKAEARWLKEIPELTLNLDFMEVNRGKLVGIIGPVGSGKSSLLQAVLGELPLLRGSLEVNGVVSYACQEPWVFGASVRQNILFGQAYEKDRYHEVIRVCALEQDLDQFPFGDQTLVGERGSLLSGGQKARINLARAVYRQADVYLLDDPLSAVDAHVGHHLFKKCIMSHLRHRTRLLVTHQLHYLKDADHIILLKNGKIEMQGTYHNMSNSSLQYAQLLVPTLQDVVEEGRAEERVTPTRERSNSRASGGKKKKLKYDSNTLQRNRSDSLSMSMCQLDLDDYSAIVSELNSDEEEQEKAEPHKEQHAVAEASSENVVKGSMGMQYFRAGDNCLLLTFVVTAFLVSQLFVSSADYWMAYWTSQEELRAYYTELGNSSTTNLTQSANFTTAPTISANVTNEDTSWIRLPEFDTIFTTDTCIKVHGTIVALGLAFTLLRSFSFYSIAMKASQTLHDLMFRGVIRAPMLFFNTNSSGRIMNRFAKDVGSIDEILPKAILDASQVILQIVGSIVLACYVNPYFLLPVAVIGFVFMGMRKMYLKTSKNIKRMEGIARSPVFTHLNATLQGLSTIRAYGAQEILKEEFDHYQDVHTSAWYMFITTSSAFSLLLDLMCFLLISFVVFSFLLIPSDILGDKVGLAITQCMSLSFIIQYGVRQTAEVANQLMAVERVLEYGLLPPEAGVEPDEIDKKSKLPESLKIMAAKLKQPPRNWPEYGYIAFKDLYLKYTEKEEDAYVLKGLNCEFKPKEKIGIVGRTGAGKSSLISALFRLAYNKGSVVIDGIDTKDISLTNLRKQISIIPQDPVLFSGTLRRNLDPFEEFSDAAVWQALDEVELKEATTGPGGLDSKVMDGGSNFSVGQRQLVCLARAVLRNNRILMLDEATANVDPHTDSLIQKTIREKFVNCTVLTVAHRLNTIMDSDRVLVMDQGKMVELAHPYILLQNQEGFLTKMAAETGKQNAETLFSVAKENYLSKYNSDDLKLIDE